MTDSAGVQKESYMLGVPCITLRENAECVGTVSDGWNVLVGSDYAKIMDAMEDFYESRVKGEIFGKGDATERIDERISSI